LAALTMRVHSRLTHVLPRPLSARPPTLSLFSFFNDPATTEISTLSLHDALPTWRRRCGARSSPATWHAPTPSPGGARPGSGPPRSEEHTSELQSLTNLVCRLLLEKKKKPGTPQHHASPTGRHRLRSTADGIATCC